jgi:hypothetical protein
MSFTVRELPKAKHDKASIIRWLYERSPMGAAAWLDAYDKTIEQLTESATAFSTAPENDDSEFDVRQALFNTRRGRVYRVLFFVNGDEVFILRVRGPGQAPVMPDDLQ